MLFRSQQAGLTAAQANQQARQQAALQNLSAGLQTQGLQAQTGLTAAQANQQAGLTTAQQNAQMAQQAALANQQAGLTTGQQNLQALLSTQQLGTQTGMQAALANQQAAMDAQKLYEQSRQFGATSGLQSAQQLGAMGAQLGEMGGKEQQLALDRAQALGTVGQQQQALQQQQLDQAYQDYAAQRDYEQNMINWYNSILRGVPVNANTAVYNTTPSPSAASQMAGMGLGALGLYKGMQG